MMETEVWILGGTGRSARAIAAELVSRGIAPVLVGRDAARLTEAAAPAGAAGRRTVAAGSVEAMAAEIRRQQPAVVINTIGPFTATAPPVVGACLEGSEYVDLANDVAAVSALLGMDGAAAAAGRTLVTGGGFGVTATESVVVKLCEGRPAGAWGRPGSAAMRFASPCRTAPSSRPRGCRSASSSRPSGPAGRRP
jgi:short subunit dehydrogenase-like uncharacterized protein